jgi:hypothetical protein
LLGLRSLREQRVVISMLRGDGGRHVLKEIWCRCQKEMVMMQLLSKKVFVSCHLSECRRSIFFHPYLPLLNHRCLRIFHVAEERSAFKVCMKQLDFSLYMMHVIKVLFVDMDKRT